MKKYAVLSLLCLFVLGLMAGTALAEEPEVPEGIADAQHARLELVDENKFTLSSDYEYGTDGTLYLLDMAMETKGWYNNKYDDGTKDTYFVELKLMNEKGQVSFAEEKSGAWTWFSYDGGENWKAHHNTEKETFWMNDRDYLDKVTTVASNGGEVTWYKASVKIVEVLPSVKAALETAEAGKLEVVSDSLKDGVDWERGDDDTLYLLKASVTNKGAEYPGDIEEFLGTHMVELELVSGDVQIDLALGGDESTNLYTYFSDDDGQTWEAHPNNTDETFWINDRYYADKMVTVAGDAGEGAWCRARVALVDMLPSVAEEAEKIKSALPGSLVLVSNDSYSDVFNEGKDYAYGEDGTLYLLKKAMEEKGWHNNKYDDGTSNTHLVELKLMNGEDQVSFAKNSGDYTYFSYDDGRIWEAHHNTEKKTFWINDRDYYGRMTTVASDGDGDVYYTAKVAVVDALDISVAEKVSSGDFGIGTENNPAGTQVPGVSMSVADGAVTVTNEMRLDGDGFVAGDAKKSLDGQVPADGEAPIGGDASKGYVGYTVYAPEAEELLSVNCYHDGILYGTEETPVDVMDNVWDTNSKGYVTFYPSVAADVDASEEKAWVVKNADPVIYTLVWNYSDNETPLYTKFTVTVTGKGSKFAEKLDGAVADSGDVDSDSGVEPLPKEQVAVLVEKNDDLRGLVDSGEVLGIVAANLTAASNDVSVPLEDGEASNVTGLAVNYEGNGSVTPVLAVVKSDSPNESRFDFSIAELVSGKNVKLTLSFTLRSATDRIWFRDAKGEWVDLMAEGQTDIKREGNVVSFTISTVSAPFNFANLTGTPVKVTSSSAGTGSDSDNGCSVAGFAPAALLLLAPLFLLRK